MSEQDYAALGPPEDVAKLFRIAATQTADVIQHANVRRDTLQWFGNIDALTGHEPGEFPRTLSGWLALIHPDDIDRLNAEYEHAVNSGAPTWSFRYRIRAKDGSYRHWLDRGEVTELVDGKINVGVGAIVDETAEVLARQELERALAERNEHARLNQDILTALSSRLAVLDREGEIVAVNESWVNTDFEPAVTDSSAMLGVGSNYLDVCKRATNDDAQQAFEGIQSVLDGSEPSFEMTYECHGPSRTRWFSMQVTPMQSEGAIVVHTDISEQMRAQEELGGALEEIKALRDRLQAESQYLQEEIKSEHNFEEIIGRSPALMETLERIEQVADTNATVLLQGETGTGKELMARAIHARSPRSKRPLIKVDCTTLPPGLIESELFGHDKGAFTGALESKAGRFELADGGTILLDEIGELPLELQPKLLRVIQEGELQRLGSKRPKRVDVRVVAATNRDLHAAMRAGEFRADLYYRLNVFPIQIPPLRDRREDIPALASFFLSQRGKQLGRAVDRIPPQAMAALSDYDWPGNVRELQNVIERALILSPGCELVLPEPFDPPSRSGVRPARGVLQQDLEQIERQRIIDVLDASGWKIKGDGNAASRLGLKPSTLRSRMKRLGIERAS